MKDMAMADKPYFTEIGNGNINFDGIIRTAAEIGVSHYVVEQDTCPGDPFDSLAASRAYIKEHFM
jgi:sugar phosphate isomerase/epimerase